MKNHTPKNTPADHMTAFYETFETMRHEKFDGMIITGAPVEKLPFEQVNYWRELTEIFEWSRTHVTSTLYICWAAQAGLYHHYGIPKYVLQNKIFGVFEHTINAPKCPIFRGFDASFYVPHSRFTEVRRSDIERVEALTVLSESEEVGVYMLMANEGREIYVTGHSEYAPYTLADEYKRDALKGMNTDLPVHYFKQDDPSQAPLLRWRAHANLFFSNWLNYYVYQRTPYDINTIK